MEERHDKCKNGRYGPTGCPFPVFEDGYCIFHLPKLTAKAKRLKSPYDMTEYRQIEEAFEDEMFMLLGDVECNKECSSYNFTGFQFARYRFHDKVFSKPVVFNSVNFYENVDFVNLKFENEVRFENVTFDGSVSFINAEFKKECSFFKSIIVGEWRNRTLEFATTNFHECRFNGPAHFSGVTFRGWADYQSVLFNKGANFRFACFADKVNFENVTFLGETYFDRSSLCAKSLFVWCNFYDTASFEQTIFHGQMRFQEVDFRDVSFKEAVIKSGLLFKGSGNAKIFTGECDFSKISTEYKDAIIFEKTNLSKASFGDTNLINVSFRDVIWSHTENKYRGRRIVLWDEIQLLDEGRSWQYYYQIAENYSQLVINHENKRDFLTAEIFHIGEMELRRKANSKFPYRRYSRYDLMQRIEEELSSNSFQIRFKKYVSIIRGIFFSAKAIVNEYSLYRILSNYGTSYILALTCMVIMLAAIAVIALYCGFDVIGEKPANYDLGWGVASLRDIVEAFGFALSALPGVGGGRYIPEGLGSTILRNVATLVLSGQLALVLLAVRRRFKR